ncbi:MAG: CHAT domain-containing tetratricopeptide repeat protein [Bacteroidota bacterium]
MKKLLFLLTLIFCLSVAFGQNSQKIDSLKQILKTLPELKGTDADTTRMKLYLDIGDFYEHSIPDSAIWWYSMATDTNFIPENIKLYQKKARINASALRYIGYVAKNQGKYSDADSFYGHSLKIYEELGDKEGISKCLIDIGIIAKAKGNYSAAISYYEKSLKIDEELGNKAGVSVCLNNLGNVASLQGNYSAAISYYERSLKNYEESCDKARISACLLNLGNVTSIQGNYTTAISYYERSLKISDELGKKDMISMCLNNLGIATYELGNYSATLTYYKRSLKISEELGNKGVISKCLMNLGTIASKQGNYAVALSYHERSMKIFEELEDKLGISKSLNSLGFVAMYHGNYSAALSYFERSLKISEELGDKDMISMCLNNLGVVAENQRNYSAAQSYYDRSLKISEEIGDKTKISMCLNNLGIVASNQGNYSSALSYFEHSLKIRKELGNKEGISLCLRNLGNVASNQGNYSAVISYYLSSLKISEELGNKADLASNYPTLAKAYIKQNMIEKAIPLFLFSRDITLWLLKDNFAILSESEKEMYLDKTKSVFNDIHAFSINYKEQNDSLSSICFNNELVLKGLLLKSTVSVMDIVYNRTDTVVKDTYFLLKQYRDQISDMQGSEVSNRDSVIVDFENKANEQERKLVKMSSEFADIQNLFNSKWQDVQKNLKSGEAAIEFVSFIQGDKNDTTVYAALIITPESKMPVSIKLFEDEELQKILGKSTGTGYNYVSPLYGAKSTALYNLIWKPLEPTLAEINTVYYAPVGVLNKISFAALSKESGKMLCDIYNLQQVSTTGKLIKQEVKTELKMTAAVFGGIDYNTDTVELDPGSYRGWKYLPGTLNEKEKIEEQFNKNNVACRSFSGREAKEENFKALFDSTDAPSILHVSTHGFFYPDPEQLKKEAEAKAEAKSGELIFRGANGFGNWMFLNNKNPMMRSGLVFAGANKVWSEDWRRTDNEGVLTAYEVSNLNMRNTQLVVLSACETGLGDIRGSEGVYGLQRAFKMAGVKYIIMSLWQVPDKETVEFMEMFYKKLLKEKDVRMAFNETQKEMRNKYNPYFWAAFVLIE